MLVILATTASGQNRTFIGTVTRVTADFVTVRGEGKDMRFSVNTNTRVIPRAVKLGDDVWVTYVEADVAVAVEIEVIIKSAQ